MRHARILVVEDDRAINKVVCSYLGKMGAACTAAFSGTEGLLQLSAGAASARAGLPAGARGGLPASARAGLPASARAGLPAGARAGLPAGASGHADSPAGAAPWDLLVSDLMLPGVDGEEVVAAAVEAGVPVIVLSARASVGDRVELLRLGADDYLVKPFDLEELHARVEAVLRRARGGKGSMADPGPGGAVPVGTDLRGAGLSEATAGDTGDTGDVLRYGAWELDEAGRTFCANGISVHLTPTEFAMVRALMAAPRRVQTKRNLSQAAAGDADALEDKAVATHIGNIRAKLKAAGSDDYLETVWGVGFKLRELP